MKQIISKSQHTFEMEHRKLHSKATPKDLEEILMLSFWLCVHLNRLRMAKYLLSKERFLRKLLFRIKIDLNKKDGEVSDEMSDSASHIGSGFPDSNSDSESES